MLFFQKFSIYQLFLVLLHSLDGLGKSSQLKNLVEAHFQYLRIAHRPENKKNIKQ